MKKCPFCGHSSMDAGAKCTECGRYYSKVLQLIEEEQAYEYEHSLRGRYQRIINATSIKQELKSEIREIIKGLDNKARFTLFVIFAFVFALIVTVL